MRSSYSYSSGSPPGDTKEATRRKRPFLRSFLKPQFLLLAPLIGWLTLFAQVRHYWGEGSYYAYGWSIPFLAFILGLRRLRSGTTETTATGPESSRPLLLLGCFMTLMIPLRLVAEPDPYWRLPLWIQAILLIVITLLTLRLLLGQYAWRAFLFPCLFALTALPWPTFAESGLVHTLTGWVTAMDVEILLLSGQPAQALNSGIQVAGQSIEIDATCSGIRSFQCLLAFGLFFGEYFRLGLAKRVLVAFGGLFFAFAFNLVRAITLSFLALEAKSETFDAWHDPVGNSAIALAFLSLLFFSRLVASRGTKATEAAKPMQFTLARPTRARLLLVLAILPEATTRAWFQYGVEERVVPAWTVDWTAIDQDKLTFIPFRKTTLDALLFDQGKRALLELDDGTRAEIFFYEYDGSRPAASVCSRHHNPAICMAATAANLVGGNEATTIEVGQASLRFAQYVTGKADYEGKYNLHAFWCPWTPDTRSGTAHFQDFSRSEQIGNFLKGRIDYARKVLLVVIMGRKSMKEAQADLQSIVGDLLLPTPN